MGKRPAFFFFPNDWLRDMEEYPLYIKGAWIDILCKLWWSETRGESTKSLREWMNFLREKKQKTIEIVSFLEEKKIANVSGLLSQSLNQRITIISRRMVEDERISQLRRASGRLGGSPLLKKTCEKTEENQKILLNQNGKQKPTPPIPSPFSSPIPKEYKEKKNYKKKRSCLINFEAACKLIDIYNTVFDTNRYRSENEQATFHDRINGFAAKYEKRYGSLDKFSLDAADLIVMVKETWGPTFPKGLENIFRYGMRNGEDAFITRMEQLNNWRSGIKTHKHIDDDQPPLLRAGR